ncbi:MAG TPA: YbdK family carboxylate-amine ligase [Solirubrobacteraceae bacterium]|nr:YbdK family carboxylate-amine ligase [Solirubrobacteraceae bacterium]
MSIDIAAAEEVFAASTDGTVGLEEEFAILDPATLDLVPRFELLRDSAPPELAPQLAGELIASEIEIVSGRGEDFADALARQRRGRRLLVAHAHDHGLLLGATGTHPWADYREQPNIDTDHYRRVVTELGYAARRNNSFSLHVHVGVRGIERAIAVCDRLRPVLPLLLAASASSPFLERQDTLLHSARSEIFTRTFPRCGVPDAFGSWAAYREYIELLVRTSSIVEFTQVWWSVRPHFSFGTVEVRICDAQPSADESDALAALIVAVVNAAARDHDAGVPFADPPSRLIEENVWRAIRYGMDGRLIDLERGEEVEARTALERLATWAGHDLTLPAANGAQRQRALFNDGASLQDVYAAIVEETRSTYGRAAEPIS